MSDKDLSELKEILDTVSDKVPGLIGNLVSAVMTNVYSPEAGQQLGKAVGAFYNELVASGIPAEEALKMAKDYLGVMGSALEKAKAEKH
jgi:ribulose kinase